MELQHFADKTGLTVVVSHYPQGTSKWNKIEHRMFSYISRKKEGKPLLSVETIIDLIESTTTRNGLSIQCQLDTNKYELGVPITDGMLERIKITPRTPGENEEDACSEQLAKWNYTIQPRNEEEQRIAKEMDSKELLEEQTRVKRKYTKKEEESN